MCWLCYGILFAITSQILSPSIPDLVYFPISILNIHEIFNPTSKTILDGYRISKYVIMDMLYIIWMSKWPFYVRFNPYLIYHPIFYKSLQFNKKIKNYINNRWYYLTINGCFLTCYTRHAFN